MRRAALIGTSFVVVVAAALVTFLLGSGGSLRFAGRAAPWTDVDGVRAALAPESRGVFDLVVALHGRDGRGGTDWSKAQQSCRALQWPRCDMPALGELKAASRPSGAGRKPPEAAALAVADAIWAFGNEDAARKMFRTELDRIPESDGPGRGRVFVRFGVLESNPDGQAALFAQACVADPNVCDLDRLKQAAQRETRARFVPPGNVVPLYFGGHPRISGHP